MGKLPAHSELRWAPPAQNESLPFPKQLKQAPTPLVPTAFPQGEHWNRKRMARTKRQKLCRKLGVLSAKSSQSQTHGRLCCQSVLTPKSALLALRVQPKECNPWWSAAPGTHLGPKLQRSCTEPHVPQDTEHWCLRAWRVAVFLSNSPSRAARSSPSPNSLPLGIPQIRDLPGLCLNRA